MGGARLFCFTNFDMNADYDKWFEDHANCSWLIIGDEICPETGKPHHQGACYFPNKLATFKNKEGKITSRKLLKDFSHVEACVGSVNQNDKYCKKEGNFREWGKRPSQGNRTDLKGLKDKILDGSVSVDDIVLEDPEVYHQYGRTLNKIEDIALRKKFRTWKTCGIWVYGPTGVGKTVLAFKNFSPETHYVKPSDGEWWDGYTGQEHVIFNEFRGCDLLFKDILAICDWAPFYVRRRGREPVPFLAKYVWITSSIPPEVAYGGACDTQDKIDQLYRRFDILPMKKQGDYQDYTVESWTNSL